ncbi:MAG: adenylyltransferase/cytidyltransferase family protein [Clostridia bacterium]|nr:adenylyltransferase/cytidyltransferase family protein [Clostridia bacterium]
MKKVGFTIGKFAPLHKGHQYLIETALKEMDELYVIVYETDLIDISVEKRAEWIKELYPTVNVILAKNPPKKYGMDEDSAKIQTDYLKKVLGDVKGTHFFSSEKYGSLVAKNLNVENRVVDYKREYVPISATKVRSNIDEYSRFVNKIVYDDIKTIKKS